MTVPSNISVNPLSCSSLLVFLAFRDQALGHATGFVVTRDASSYLITNWHVATGRRADDPSQPADPETAAWPDRIAVAHHKAGQLGVWPLKVEALYDASGAPRWLEHPTHGHLVDAVALPLTNLDDLDLYPLDPWAAPLAAMPMASQLSVIGFPLGMTSGGAFGVWVTGFVASEPDIDLAGLPRLLIDSRTRKGQSGSPVINYRSGPFMDVNGAFVPGVAQDLIGVYSGRITADSDLGFVWKASAVREIIEGGVRGTIEGPP
jgi:hypothetical protein